MMTREYGKGYDEGYADGLKDAPQRTWERPWVSLTDEEIAGELYKFEAASAWYQFARAIEAKLKQKNGYAEEKNT